MSVSALAILFGWLVVVGICMLIAAQVRKQHLATNSRLDQLLDVTKRLATKEGYDAGRASRDLIEEVGQRIGEPDAPRSG